MSKILDDSKIEMGRLIPVENGKRRASEAESYFALKVEDESGGRERWLLLTKGEVDSRKTLAVDSVTSGWKPGRLFRCRLGKRVFYAGNVERSKSGMPSRECLSFPEGLLERARLRAERNPEDVPRQSRLSDWLD